jgi:tetratricopeptide (TPR) repeat protein
VAVITDEGGEHLERTIASAAILADEIVLVAADGAAPIDAPRTSVPLAVVEHQSRFDRAAARNAALEAAGGEFVLWLEAGEALDGQAAESLRRFVATDADRRTIYGLTLELASTSGDRDPWQAVQPRLMPRTTGLRFSRPLRESIQPAAERLEMKFLALPCSIQHSGPAADRQSERCRAERNLEILSRAEDCGELDAELHLARSEAHVVLGDTAAAILSLEKALDLAPRGSLVRREIYRGLVVTLARNPAQATRSETVCAAALEEFPHDAWLLCAAAECQWSANRIELAVELFRQAVEEGSVEPEIWHRASDRSRALARWAAALEAAGDLDQAERLLVVQLASRKCDDSLRWQLLGVLIKSGKTHAALKVVDRLSVDPALWPAVRNAVRGGCLAVERDWIPAWNYLRQAYESGFRGPICLKWMAVTLISTGQHFRAETVLRQWEAIEPASSELRSYLREVDDWRRAVTHEHAPAARNGAAARPRPQRTRVDSSEPVPPAPIIPQAAPVAMWYEAWW